MRHAESDLKSAKHPASLRLAAQTYQKSGDREREIWTDSPISAAYGEIAAPAETACGENDEAGEGGGGRSAAECVWVGADVLSALRNLLQAAGDGSEFCGTYSGPGASGGVSTGAGAELGDVRYVVESTADFTEF